MNISATPAFKALNLKLIIASRKSTTVSTISLLRLNKLKPFKKQRSKPIIESLLNLIASSSPILSQLSKFLDSILLSDFLSSK